MRPVPEVRSAVIGIAAVSAAMALALPGVALASRATSHVSGRVIAAPQLPSGARVLGATPLARQLQVSVYLQPRSAKALASYVASVSDVHSKLFRHYLARGAFAARFGPTTSSIRAVESFARAQGLRVDALSSNHLDLSLSGSVARFSTAFATHLSEVRLASGEVGRVATAPVHLSASISPSVVAVLGLNDVLHAHTSLERGSLLRRALRRGGRDFPSVRPHVIPGAPSACSDATDATELGFGGITDDQVASAYGADGLYAAGDLGAGQTVAIFELEPFAMSDVRTFEECYFSADHTSQITTINVDHGPGTGYGSAESALDIENVAAIAPAAHIDVYQAPNTSYGSLDAYNKIVSDDAAQVVTSSWGFCETDQLKLSPGALAAENLVFEQAAAQGQTVFNSSGDSGDDACAYDSGSPSNPVLSVGDPASQPYVVGVGGTTAVTVNQPPKEQVWNDGALGGAGSGGISTIWSQPPWLGAKANALSSATPCDAPPGEVCRTVPDVSAFADEYTGITIYVGGFWGTIGGTSSSSPLWAAMLALINASSTCTASVSTVHGVGFAAPLLYFVASNPTDYASGFNDVTLGNNDDFGVEHGKYPALKGYDLATGIGTPELTPAPSVIGPGLAESLCDAAQGATTAHVTSISPTHGGDGGGTHFTITGTGFKQGATADVAEVTFGTSPAASFRVVSATEITGTTSSATTPTTNALMNKLARHSGGVLVSVTTTNKEVALGPSFHYTVEGAGKGAPTVVQVGPTGGNASGGNTVNLYGTGFTGATKVTFGGVEATSFKIVSDTQIAAVAPKLTSKQVCLAASKLATLGLCQTQVQVTGPGGVSPTFAALKPYTGFLETNELGALVVPKKCKCEAYPTITEYDYGRASLTKIVGGNGKTFTGDPNGFDFAEFIGTGFNVLTLNWIVFGPPLEANSIDTQEFAVNPAGTEIQGFTLGDPNPGPNGDSVPVAINTLAGNTNPVTFHFASVPEVDAVSSGVVPSSGGTTITITGKALAGVTQVVFNPYSGADPPVPVLKNFVVNSATKITLPSPSMVPGAYQIVVCDRYSCASGDPTTPVTSTINVIFPGETVVTSADTVPGGAQPIIGPTAGGTTFEVQGANFGPLGDLTIYLENGLGEMVATTGLVAGPSPTDPGATETVLVTSPPSLGGIAEYCAVVAVGDNGTSAESITALFEYQ